ncbi:MAG: T9SS type A sorting domain-containing protein [Bacteroidota bacterium]
MKHKLTLSLLLILLQISIASAQVPKDATVPISVTVNSSPLSVTLNWSNPSAANLLVLRHRKGDAPNLWYQLLNVTNSTLNSGTDGSVIAGETYEYVIQRFTTINAYGYAHVAVNAPVVDKRGKILVFVDSTTADALGVELVRMKNDMRGDGWEAVPIKVGPSATVQSVKAEIVNRYKADSLNVKAVFLIGHVPIPYSGNTNWDGHPEHQGAWPCDNYYADMDGVWTDNTVNNSTSGRAANTNIPGDGKFDQSVMPSAAELQVGRLDFRRLTVGTFGLSEIELLRRYLDKNHNFRTKQYIVANKALVDDNFGYFSGEAFAENGFRNAYPVVGESNIVEADFFNNTNPDTYLLGYACGGGWYSGANGVGSSTNFGTDTVNVVFSNLFGSYFGDWDYETDPFMPSALASKGGILTCGWAGRPHFFLQGLASGETIGYCMKETQNTQFNSGFFFSYGESGAHVALLGDPTLRAQVVAPPTNVTLEQQCTKVKINWTASADPNILGYHVYRSASLGGPYNRLTGTLVAGATYTDPTSIPTSDTLFYQVRAIKQEQTPGGGIFLNNSVGPITYLVVKQPNPPALNTLSSTLTCAQPTINILVESNLPATGYIWSGPGNFTATVQNPAVSVPGAYTVTVTANNGCTNTASLAVSQNTQGPNISINGGSLTCVNTSVTLTAGSNLSLLPPTKWIGPNGFTATGSNITVSVPGIYTVTGTAQSTGCTSSASYTVQQNITLPGAVATGAQLDCNNPTRPLQGFSFATNANYGWTGPSGFTSTQQNPQVSQPGDYILTVTDPSNGCTSSATATVTLNNTPPDVSISGDGLITCAIPTLTLTANSTTNGTTFSWTGPGGFTSNQKTITITAGGTYTVIAKGTNGCTATDSRTIQTDGSIPLVSANGGIITCITPSVTLQGTVNQQNTTVSWTGSNGFISTQLNPTVTEPGTYFLTAVASNGCSATAAATVVADLEQPSVFVAPPAVLTCSVQSVVLFASSANPNALFAWTGPNGFASILPEPTVTEPGIYTVIVSGTNGCTASMQTIVTADVTPPNFTITTMGVLTCTTSCIQLQGFPSGITLEPSLICQPGTYTITATGQNGCTSTSLFTVVITPPLTSNIGNGVISCGGFGSLEATAVGGTPPYYYQWSTGQTTKIIVLPSGLSTPTLTVTDAAGCTSTSSATINVPSPISLNLSSTPMEDFPNGTATAQATGGVGSYTYLWNNGGTSATIDGLVTGTYICTVTDQNGCTATGTVFVGIMVGTDESSLVKTLRLSPNPTAGLEMLTLSLPSTGTVSISVFDPTGRLVWEKPAFEMMESVVPIDLSTQTAGMYSVSIRINNQLITRKIAVIR